MTMHFSQASADVFVPDATDTRCPTDVLAGVTHLCIAAHQDDIEVMAHSAICDCLDNPEQFRFGGVVVTNGAGSPRTGPYAAFTDTEMQLIRRDEQRRAASIGKYAIQIQLAHPSDHVKIPGSPGHTSVLHDLDTVLAACKPQFLYLHQPADKHDTHIAVLLCCLSALRRLPSGQRPPKVLGCEVWRDLDWLPDKAKVALDSGRRPELAQDLLRAFDSQVTGGKRYDLATAGRRLANATFNTPHATDQFSGITWAMDLTPLLTEPAVDIASFTLDHIDRLRDETESRLKRYSAD